MLPSIGMPSVVRRIEKRRRVFILIEFIQGNAQWLVLGAVFLLMMKMHGSGRGMGCCGGHQHESREQERQPDQQPRSLPDPAGEGTGKGVMIRNAVDG